MRKGVIRGAVSLSLVVAVGLLMVAGCAKEAENGGAEPAVGAELPSVAGGVSLGGDVAARPEGAAALSYPQGIPVSGVSTIAAMPVATEAGQLVGLPVSGTGSATATPDLAVVSLGVQARDDFLGRAQEDAAGRMNRVITALQDGGVAKKDIATASFQIFPETKYRDNTIVGVTYRVSHTITVKVRQIESTGKLVDAAVKAGANVVNSVSLTVEDPKPYRQKAREEAVQDAQATATQLAQLAGVTLGRPIYVAESDVGLVRPMEYALKAMAGEAAGAPTPITPGEMEITVTVNIIYTIE